MNISLIRTLLDKFYAGNTTLEEEDKLRKFLNREDLSKTDLLSDQDYFRLMSDFKSTIPQMEGMEEKLADFLERNINTHHTRTFRLLSPPFITIAASVLLLLILTIAGFNNKFRKQPRDTFTDPQFAYNEARKTLLFVSQKFNSGLNPVNNVSKISTGSEQLNELLKIEFGVNMLNNLNNSESSPIKSNN